MKIRFPVAVRLSTSSYPRMLRSGGWYVEAGLVLIAYRDWGSPDNRWTDLGFRLIIIPEIHCQK